MKFYISVERVLYQTGKVEVDCDNPEQGVDLVENQIKNKVLKQKMIEWSEGKYIEGSFKTTGDVD